MAAPGTVEEARSPKRGGTTPGDDASSTRSRHAHRPGLPRNEGQAVALSRRDVLKMSLLAGGAFALPLERTGQALTAPTNHMASSALPLPFTVPFATPSVLAPVRADATTDYYRISMNPFLANVLPGFETPMWGYNSEVPGPTLRATRGRRTVVRFVNNLPAKHPVLQYTPWTSVHLHGSPSLPQYDGYASDITNPGQYK